MMGTLRFAHPTGFRGAWSDDFCGVPTTLKEPGWLILHTVKWQRQSRTHEGGQIRPPETQSDWKRFAPPLPHVYGQKVSVSGILKKDGGSAVQQKEGGWGYMSRRE